MATIILAFLLFFLPFVVIPFGISPFEFPKVIAAEIGIEILLVIKLFQKNIHINQFNKRQMLLILPLIILTLIDLVFFPSPTAFFGNPFRLQGIFLLWHLLAFSILSNVIPDLIGDLDSRLPITIYILSLVLLLITAISFGGNENGRAIGTLGEPNALAATAAFFLPFLFGQKNLIKILGFIFALIIIFLSGSRSGLIAIGVESVFLLLKEIVKLSVAKSFILAFILFILSLSLPLIENGGWFENRSVIWQTAFVAGLKSPVLGWGFGNIETALHQTSVEMKNLVQHQFIDSAHNIFLDFWVQGGVVGLISLLLIIFFSIKNLIAKSKLLELTIFLGLITVMSFNPVSVVTLVAFWWVVGQGFREQGRSLHAPKDGNG